MRSIAPSLLGTWWIGSGKAPEDRAELLSKLNIAATGNSWKDFGAFTKALIDQHRVLHICRQIATGSKHKEVEFRPDPEVFTEEYWDIKPVRGSSCSIRLFIRDRGKRRAALEVFGEAAQTWEGLLREWGYLEARYVDDRC